MKAGPGTIAALCLAALMSGACHRPAGPENAHITDFPTLFRENCSGCHGQDGKFGPARPLNDPTLLAIIPRDTLRQVIENGRPGTAMPPFAHAQGGPLDAEQVSIVVDGIERNWGKPMKFGSVQPPPYAVENATPDIRNGARLFAGNCFMCHAKGARVGPVTDPTYLALVSDQGLRSSIITGRRDLGMPDWRFLHRGQPLSDQDLVDLTGYLSSLRPASSPLAQASSTPAGENSSGTGARGATAKGNEGSGTGPGSPRQEKQEGNQSNGGSSQSGGPGSSGKKTPTPQQPETGAKQ